MVCFGGSVVSGALCPDFLDPLRGKAEPFQITLMPRGILPLEQTVALLHCRLIQSDGPEAGNPVLPDFIVVLLFCQYVLSVTVRDKD